jgi:hypothetical protein
MKQFEYQQFTVETTGIVSAKLNESFINQLNMLGKDGWELVQALPIAEPYGKTGSVSFIMKKEIR